MRNKPVIIGNAELYLADCADVIEELSQFDAMVTDPPYGIGEAAVESRTPGRLADAVKYAVKDWDKKRISRQMRLALFDKAKWVVWFGANHYGDLPSATCWLVWDKVNGKSHFADCELAWTNLAQAVRLKRYMWNGMLTDAKESRGYHPTQKPVDVMAWAISQCPDNATVFDPFMGSGSTGIAAVNMGLRFVGIERESDYFDTACERIELAQRQERLFAYQGD